MLTIRFGIS